MSDSVLDESEVTVPRRKLWVIIPLAILGGPMAFVYCGRLKNAIVWQLSFLAYGLLTMAGMIYTPWTRFFLAVLALGVCLFYSAIVLTAWVGQQRHPWRPYQRWWAYGLIYFALLAFSTYATTLARDYWCEAFVIPAGSMRETILPGDRILVEKLMFAVNGPKRNSLVVFRSLDTNDPPDLSYVKRLVAMSGDKIRMQGGVVYLNEHKLDEPYTTYLGELDPRATHFLQEMPEQTVPEGHYFLVGDNRWNSLDSRYFGFVPVDNLVGEAKAVFWSREYEQIHPTRDNPTGGETVGNIRWERIGRRLE